MHLRVYVCTNTYAQKDMRVCICATYNFCLSLDVQADATNKPPGNTPLSDTRRPTCRTKRRKERPRRRGRAKGRGEPREMQRKRTNRIRIQIFLSPAQGAHRPKQANHRTLTAHAPMIFTHAGTRTDKSTKIHPACK